MDEMILIPKIEESVTCNVYKRRVAALMKNKKFFSIFSAKLGYNSLLNTVRK
jgi:predicted secreted protein